MKNRIFLAFIAILGGLLLVIFCVRYFAVPAGDEAEDSPAETAKEEHIVSYEDAESDLSLWFSDPGMERFFDTALRDYFLKTGIKAEARLLDSPDYIEALYEAGMKGEGPDLYLIGNDALEEMVLYGMASKTTLSEGTLLPETARQAVTLRGDTYGYPLCYDTPIYVYLTAAFPEAPVSIRAMLDRASEEELPIEVGNLFEWDLTDEFYDMPFVGDCYLFSDEKEGQLSVTRDDALYEKKAAFLENLSDSITMDAETTSEEMVVSRLNHRGTASAVIAASDLPKVHESIGILPLIPLDDELVMKGMAKTEALLINDLSEKREEASRLAAFLLEEEEERISEETRFFPVTGEGIPEEKRAVQEAYEKAFPMPHSLGSTGFLKDLVREFIKLF